MKSRTIMWAVATAGIAHAAYYHTQLPDRVAIHFGAGGAPDGWAGKDSFLILSIGLYVFMTLLFEGVNWIIARTPTDLINMPHREYWFAPARRDTTLAILRDQMNGYAVATMIFLLITFHLSIQVNLGHAETLGRSFHIALVTFLGGTVLWAIRLYTMFRRVPERS